MRGRLRIITTMLLAASMLAAMAAEPLAAKGLKEKLGIGRKDKAEPSASLPPETPAAAAAADDSKAGPGGTRDVLVITEPRHLAAIDKGATIAFIDFNHIEHEFPDFLDTYTRVEETTVEHGYGHEAFTSVRRGVYNSRVCARQVEAALAQHLADLNLFKVVTREHIKSVVEELDRKATGRYDTSRTATLGKLIGADILIYGQVQLCVSSQMNFDEIADAVGSVVGGIATGDGGGRWANLLGGLFKKGAPEKLRSFVLAQIQLIRAETGERVFTTSLTGEFNGSISALDFKMEHRELVHHAADDLANQFIDDFLARKEARYMDLYQDPRFDFGKGIDLIQLGSCGRAERHFRTVYERYGTQMDERDLARLMYNHGVALMCANQPEAAADRLWASLRLVGESRTFEAIEFTNDIIDRGRLVVAETDPVILAVEQRRYPGAQSLDPVELTIGGGAEGER